MVRVSGDAVDIAAAHGDAGVTRDAVRVFDNDAVVATANAGAKVMTDELRVSSYVGIATKDASAKGRIYALWVLELDDAAVADANTNGDADAVAFDFQPYVRL